MPPENNRKELGLLQGQMGGLQKSQERMEKKIDKICDQLVILPKHDERIRVLERTKRIWGSLLISVVVIVVGAIAVALIIPK